MKNQKSISPKHLHPFFSPGKVSKINSTNKKRCKTLERDRQLYPRISQRRYQMGSISKSSAKKSYKESLIKTLSPYSNSIFQKPGEQLQIQNNLKSFVQNNEPYCTNISIHKPYFQFQVADWQNDFYYDLLDWSSQTNTICVGNQKLITFYNANIISSQDEFHKSKTYFNLAHYATALKFSHYQKYVAFGKVNANIDIYDYDKEKIVQVLKNHENQITALDWKQQLISSCRNGKLIKRDLRDKSSILISKIQNQICSIKQNNGLLAIGTDLHEVFIFDLRNQKVLDSYNHNAAVKAICWKPKTKQLISGGGMKCKTLKFWNPTHGVYNSYSTESQISSIICSKTTDEFITTHGFGLKKMIKWTGFGKIQSIYEGHNDRILYSAQSPDNGTIITGSPDNKVMFWRAFPKLNSNFLEDSTDLR